MGMHKFPLYDATPINKDVYDSILAVLKQIMAQHYDKVTPMHVDPYKLDQLFGYHLLLTHDEENSDYLVVYETDLFRTIGQVRIVNGPMQVQYTMEPNDVILVSQFRVDGIDEDAELDTNTSVISLGQPISDAEANGLMKHLERLIAR